MKKTLCPLLRAIAWLVVQAALLAGNAQALECGKFGFPYCETARTRPAQFAGGFDPPAPFGGFGGGEDCRGSNGHTPVILIHGNADNAIGWASPALKRAGRPEKPSVYAELKARGYTDCEVFGVTYLDPDTGEQEFDRVAGNFHQPKRYEIIWNFIRAVKDFTGSDKVDIVTHSLGSSMTLAALDYYTDERLEQAWASVRRFVNIAGGLRGLNSCMWVSPIDYPTCQAEQGGGDDAYYGFGFFPDLPYFVRNRWTAVSGEHSLRQAPARHPDVDFYTITAGWQDDIHCPQYAPPGVVRCDTGPHFASAGNVRAQADIGAPPAKKPPAWAKGVPDNIRAQVPRDLGGIAHFGARNYAGPIIARMLESDCRGAACKGSYVGAFRVAKP